MKKFRFTFLLSLSLLALASCTRVYPNASDNSGSSSPVESSTSSDTQDSSVTIPDSSSLPDSSSSSINDQYDLKTIAELLELCPDTDGEKATERYYVKATVESIDNANYGQMTIKDDTGSISAYGTYSADGETRYPNLDDKPVAGDTVILYALLSNYKGTKQIYSGWIIEVTHNKTEIDESKYTEMTIAKAREAEADSMIKTTGYVARISYANGLVPNGYMLMDETDSIYVYDSQTAAQVAIGNKVTIYAQKAYFISSSEKNNAEKYGYKGACQLTNVLLGSNDKKVNDLDFSFAPETTIKNIMETSYSENITSKIYKVNAVIKKSEGTNFVNYYFDDLDDTTGSYAYTQANGADYDWLEQYDGQVRTVYLTALNAKSSTSGCVWRFLPVAVGDVYTHDNANTPKFVVDYYGVDQFESSYSGDPAIELTTTVDSTLLGFTGATLSYSSSDENVAYFETTSDSKTIFHLKNEGQATITITGSYQSYTSYSSTVTVSYTKPIDYESITVKEAINSEVSDTELYVKGIVGPSLVIQTGFFLVDETGLIPVVVSSDVMASVQLGHSVIIKGKRGLKITKDGFTSGQIYIHDATIASNYYGSHDYDTSTFITDKTLTDIYNLDYTDSMNTTGAYIVKAAVTAAEGYRYQKLVSGDTTLTLYASSDKQYSWLDEFVGKGEFTFEVAPCNWNSKTYIVGMVLAIYDSNNNKIVNTLNFSD